jgi:hypothetical protein
VLKDDKVEGIEEGVKVRGVEEVSCGKKSERRVGELCKPIENYKRCNSEQQHSL